LLGTLGLAFLGLAFLGGIAGERAGQSYRQGCRSYKSAFKSDTYQIFGYSIAFSSGVNTGS
jgi:hypothetical protein